MKRFCIQNWVVRFSFVFEIKERLEAIFTEQEDVKVILFMTYFGLKNDFAHHVSLSLLGA